MNNVVKICISCKLKPVNGSGEGRYYSLCPDCYKKHSHKKKKNLFPKESPGNKNSEYWTRTKLKKKRMAFKAAAMRLMGFTCVACGRNRDDTPIGIDHIKDTRFSKSLEFDMTNIQIMCAKCNDNKGLNFAHDYRNEETKRICTEYQINKNEFNEHVKKQPKKVTVILRKKSAVAGLAKQASRHLIKNSMTLIMFL